MTKIEPFITPAVRPRCWSETGSGTACSNAKRMAAKTVTPVPWPQPTTWPEPSCWPHVIAIMLKTWIRRLWPASNQQAATPKSP